MEQTIKTPSEFKALLIKEKLHVDKLPHTGIYRQSDGVKVGHYYRASEGFTIVMMLGMLTGMAHLMDKLQKDFEHIISTSDYDLTEEDMQKAFDDALKECDVRKGT